MWKLKKLISQKQETEQWPLKVREGSRVRWRVDSKDQNAAPQEN